MAENIASHEFPYQLVAFLGPQPQIGDAVYQGRSGWLPQVTLKRRFGLKALTEEELIGFLARIAQDMPVFPLCFGEIQRLKLPVNVIEVRNKEPKQFHLSMMERLGHKIHSRYPDREGRHYYPHMTVEWNGRHVVDAGHFVRTKWQIDRVWLLKDDVEADDSRVFAWFHLGKASN